MASDDPRDSALTRARTTLDAETALELTRARELLLERVRGMERTTAETERGSTADGVVIKREAGEDLWSTVDRTFGAVEVGRETTGTVDGGSPTEGGTTDGGSSEGGGEGGGSGGEWTTWSTRRQRTKLDPRLASIMSLTRDQLEAYRRIENETVETHTGGNATESGGEESAENANTTTSNASSSNEATAEAEADTPESNENLFETNGSFFQEAPRSFEYDRAQLSPYMHGFRDLRAVEDWDKAELDVFIRHNGGAGKLRALGVVVRSEVPGLVTARVTMRLIPKLEGLDEVIYIELSRATTLALDVSRELVGAEALQTATCAASDPTALICPLTASGEEDCSLTGEGVVIGVVDGGFDFRHPDFWGLEGDALRVLSIWDMSASADPAFPPPSGYTYGRLYTQSQLVDDVYSGAPGTVVPYMPPPGSHGTHVAGIAAGGGVLDPARRGVAPGAKLVCVDMINSGVLALGDMTELMDAVAFIFDQAAGAPCVVNVSLNDNLGPHDGTSYAEQFIDGLLGGPGRAVVVAAGNANTWEKHVSGKITDTATEVSFYVPALPAGVSESIEIWYSGSDRFDVLIEDPDGNAVLAQPGAAYTSIGFGGLAQLEVDHRLLDPRNGDNFVSIILLADSGVGLPTGTWTVHIRPANNDPAQVTDGRFHGWIDRNTLSQYTNGVVWTSPVDDALTVQSPGTANKVLTVANTYKTTSESLSPSSGRGPTRDGRVKPDLAAPGTAINAAKAMDWTLDPSTGAPDVPTNPLSWYTQKSGTSMSAPHVTGGVALLFEGIGGGLNALGLRDVLKDAADTTGLGGGPTEGLGFGRLRLQDAVCQVGAGPDLWIRTHSADLGVEPYVGPQPWRSPDIWVRNAEDDGSVHQNPLSGAMNYVYGVVRNRGDAAVSGARVRLYWADPSTNIPTSEWRSDGIQVDGLIGNEQTLPSIAPGAEYRLAVPFGWVPPAPGTSLAGDDHFCLLMVVDHTEDPAQLGSGGWAKVRERNNLALKNVHVIEITEGATSASMRFAVIGSGSGDALTLDLSELPTGAQASLKLPLSALNFPKLLPASLLSTVSAQLGDLAKLSQVLNGVKLQGSDLQGVRGVQALRFSGGQALLYFGGRRPALEVLDLGLGERALAGFDLTGLSVQDGDRFSVHVGHQAGRDNVGGLSAEVRVGPALTGPLRDPGRDP